MKASELLIRLKSEWHEGETLRDPELLGICQELFDDQFDPKDRNKTIKQVEFSIEKNLLLDEDVEKALEHEEAKVDEFESKVVDTKELVRQYEDHLAEQKGKIDAKKLVDEWLGQQTSTGRQQVAQLREQLIKITGAYVDAYEIAQKIAPEIGDEKAAEVAKAAIQGNEEVVNNLNIEQEIKSELQNLIKSTETEEKVDNAIREAVEKVVVEYEDGITDQEKTLIRENLRQQIEQEVYGIEEGLKEPTIKRIINADGRITLEIPGVERTDNTQTTLPKGVKIISTRVEANSKKGVGIIKAEGELNEKVKEISEMADKGGSEWKTKTGELLKMGMGDIRERKMAMRFMESGVQTNRIARTVQENDLSTQMTETVRQNIHQARTMVGLLRGEGNVGETVEALSKLAEKYPKVRGLKEANDAVQGVVKKLSEAKDGVKTLQFVKEAMEFQEKLQKFANPMVWLSKIKGLEGLAKFGGQSTIELTAALATHMLAGPESLALALKTLAATGKLLPVTAEVAVATGSTWALKIAAAFGGLPGWAILAITMAAEAMINAAKKTFGFFKNAIDGFLRNTNTNLDEIGLRDMFGNFVGGAMEWGLRGALMLGGVVVGLGSLITIPAAGIAIVIILAMAIPQLQANSYMRLITALIPNRAIEAGKCSLITSADQNNPSKVANCGGGGDASGILTNKATFVQLSGGSVNADKCFGNVVSAAKAAGVNPDFALLIWLHESGASNYALGKNVSDFGQSALGKPKDFNNQINMFLGLYPETKCLNTPSIGDDYWLAWTTNFATGDSGEECDPKKVVGGTSGEQYLSAIKNQWKQMTGLDELPASMRTPGSTGTGTGIKTSEEVDSNGDKWICEVNPNAPGLGGQPAIPMPTLDPNIKIPEGCPIGMPGDMSMFTNNITQGPRCGIYSHSGMANAVDFGVPAGTVIKATHNGIARVGRSDVYGNYVDITGSCNGVTFTTRYAHMPDGGPKVGSNIAVQAGQEIGVVDDTGSSSGNHLHYDIRGISGGSLPMSISDSLFNGSGITKNLTGCCDRYSCSPQN